MSGLVPNIAHCLRSKSYIVNEKGKDGVCERAGGYLINDKDEKQFNQIARN
ncbi:hypothetical protein GCM10009122_56850 [Fulvivirga kasyanovii]